MTRPGSMARTRVVSRVGGQRAGQRRADELRLFASAARQAASGHDQRDRDCARSRCRRRPAGGRSGSASEAAHDVAGARVVEAREQHQRAEADVAVRVRLRPPSAAPARLTPPVGAPSRPRRRHAVGVVDGAELVDRGLQLAGVTTRCRAARCTAGGRGRRGLARRPRLRGTSVADAQHHDRRDERPHRASVDRLERELQVGVLVAGEGDRIDAGVARGAVRRAARLRRRRVRPSRLR